MEESEPEPTELELKTASIGETYANMLKPVQLRKDVWLGELAKVDDTIEAAGIDLKRQCDTATDSSSQVQVLSALSLLSAKGRARHEVIYANLEDLDLHIHSLKLEQQREVEKARLALEPPEDE
jgi:hypothetical protein